MGTEISKKHSKSKMMYSIIILKQDTRKSSLEEKIFVCINHIFSRLSPLFWNIFANPPKQHVL